MVQLGRASGLLAPGLRVGGWGCMAAAGLWAVRILQANERPPDGAAKATTNTG